LILIGTRIVGVISKIDQAASDQKAIAAVESLLLNKDPTKAQDIPLGCINRSIGFNSYDTVWIFWF
jgi:dynamin 1/3